MLQTFYSGFGSSSSGIGALGINGSAFIIQLITFLIVVWVLKRYAFGPILKVLKTRRDLIDNGVLLGEEMKKEKVELEKTIDNKLHEARVEANKLLDLAKQEARQITQTGEENARTRADRIVAEAKEQIKQDTQSARKKLEKDLVGLVAEATEAIINEKVDEKKDASLIDRALNSRRTA